MKTFESGTEFSAWNPGVESTLPRQFLPLSTVFRAENVTSALAELQELSGFSGIPIEELTEFRPERLVVHELLIRVMADLSVPDGSHYEDLGINFRQIAGTILSKYIFPHIDELKQLHADLQLKASELLDQEFRTHFPPLPITTLPSNEQRSRLGRLAFNSRPTPSVALKAVEERDRQILGTWREKSQKAETAIERQTFAALVRMANAVKGKRGRLIGDAAILSALTIPLVCNVYGSELIGAHIEQHVRRAIAEEGYKVLPPQTHPVVMNVKGASASGKSTLRPLQKQLAERLGIRWDEFALISPDIWRKFLLDYNSLGQARRYAGTLTGPELAIIDKKLDRYMANKAEKGLISHLLIDRFRFDSFTAGEEDGSRLLTRFGHEVYLFFMVTPPEATVERAWKRGEQVGRYKAVDELLYHNVEAYTGMPRLLFTWTSKQDKRVHFEFLDNNVPEGCQPRTIAFGTGNEINILDVGRLLDINRFRKINVDARRPEDVYQADRLPPEKNTDFLIQCVRQMPVINFVDRNSGQIYAKVQDRVLTLSADEPTDPDTKAGLAAIAGRVSRCVPVGAENLGMLEVAQSPTLGEREPGAYLLSQAPRPITRREDPKGPALG